MKYICFYGREAEKSGNRNYILAATNKIDYIISVLNILNIEVQIVSPAWSLNKKGFYKGKVVKLNDRLSFKLFSTFGSKFRILNKFKYLWSLFQLFVFLLTKTKKNETVIVYHSVLHYYPLKIIKMLKRINLILEVEEIYSDITGADKFKKTELRMIELADSYIFSTDLLNEKLNKANKPYTIITGTYQVEEERNSKFDDDKIHVVYAGTFDPRKGGALAAAAAAEYLSNNYHLHIIGFGSEIDKKELLMNIEEISKKTTATVTYDGLMSGEEYISFIQKCQIGLSTQSPEAAYNETSFPSKILSYMANGLRVVSIRIKAIETSEIGNDVYYYEEPKPEEIAKAIMSIDFEEPYDSRKLIRQLDKKFTENIKELLETK